MNLNEKLYMQVTKDEKYKIERAAKEHDLSTEEFMRNVACYILEIIQNERLERLDKSMEELSKKIDEDSKILEENRIIQNKMDDAIARCDFDEFKRLI